MDDFKPLAAEAAQEIRRLRRENELLGAKVQMIEFLESVLHTKLAMHSVAVAEDIAWKIERALADSQAE